MAEEIKIASFRFKKSGNSCDVYVELDPDDRNRIRDIRVEWDFVPPTPLDGKLWSRRYLPLVLRKIAQLTGGSVLGIRTAVCPGDSVLVQVDRGKRPNRSRLN